MLLCMLTLLCNRWFHYQEQVWVLKFQSILKYFQAFVVYHHDFVSIIDTITDVLASCEIWKILYKI